MKIAFVVPRFGPEIGGGAETLVRQLAHALLGRYPRGTISVEAWTTCATDHRTWRNDLPPGSTMDGRITVRRFPVDERDIEAFIRAELAIQGGVPLPVTQQLDWLTASVNSAALYEHIQRVGPTHDLMIFAPYLFPISFWGALIHPERSALIPCLHNEPYAYQPIFRYLFSQVRGLICNAPGEKELIVQLYGRALRSRCTVVGMGFSAESLAEERAALLPGELRPEIRGILGHPYLLYSGRKERGKNVHVLIEWYRAAGLAKEGIRLVIIGAGDLRDVTDQPDGILDLGFVSEREKRTVMCGALALCQLSTNESFSIVLMEAWREGVPVIVHAGCAVTRGHAISSGGGLYAATAPEFAAVVRTLRGDAALRRALGAAGKRYVGSEYSWPAVLDRFEAALSQFDYPLLAQGKSAMVPVDPASATAHCAVESLCPRMET